jgi:lipid A 3-O-deacylase
MHCPSKEDRVHLTRLLPAALLLFPLAAHADPDLASIGLGGTDILNQQSRTAGDFRLEYRFGVSLVPFLEDYIKVKPLIAGETTSRQSVFGGGGIWLDIPIGKHFALTPQFVAGGYGQGNGKNLGSSIEFRSTFEAGYIFDNQSRLSFSFGHTSNAGITRRNPGTEAAVISFQIPIVNLIGRK